MPREHFADGWRQISAQAIRLCLPSRVHGQSGKSLAAGAAKGFAVRSVYAGNSLDGRDHAVLHRIVHKL
jgi:hypothetical protein